jgi:hypothetical protein
VDKLPIFESQPDGQTQAEAQNGEPGTEQIQNPDHAVGELTTPYARAVEPAEVELESVRQPGPLDQAGQPEEAAELSADTDEGANNWTEAKGAGDFHFVQIADDWYENLPPPLELLPDDADTPWEVTSALMAAVADPAGARELAEAANPPEKGPPAAPQPGASQEQVREAALPSPPPPVSKSESSRGKAGALPGYILPPESPSQGDSVQMITITLRPSHDKVRDNLRIRQIYGTLIAYPGKDRFAFQVFERGRGYLIEFPNFTTHMCPELLDRLRSFLPADLVRIEPITFM